MVQCYAVELLERVHIITPWRCEPAVKWYPLDAHLPRAANVDALAFLDVAEVDSVDATALVWYNWRFHVSNKCPLSCPEERMALDVGRTSASSQTAVLVLD